MVNTSAKPNTNSTTSPNRYGQLFPLKSSELPLENIQAEEAILGGIMIDPNALDRVIDILNPEAFYIHSHQLLYKACLELNKQRKPTDLLSLTTFLHNNQLLESIGGQCRLAQLVDPMISALNIDHHANEVMEKYGRRQIKRISNEIGQLASATNLTIEEVAKEVSNRLIEVDAYTKTGEAYRQAQEQARLNQLTRELEEIERIGDPLEQDWAIRKLSKQHGLRSPKEFKDLHAKWLQRANKTRSYTIDEYLQLHGAKSTTWLLDGWIPEKSITVLHSLGGVGKTTFVNTLCQRLITGKPWAGYDVTKPIKILWIQTDQGPAVTILLLDRQGMFALSTTEKERQRILDQWNIEDYAVLERELEQHQYDLVVIDSLTSVSSELIYKENDQEFARPFVRLRHIANKHNCAFLILHHSGKAGDMRGTTAIYNAADQVWKQERIAHPTDTIANLTIEKSRFREDHKTYRLQFDPEDHFWISIGQVTGSGENEQVDDTINPTLKRIQGFLRLNQGIGFEAEEIVEALGLNEHTCRKLLTQGNREGLINSFKGTRKRAVYFLGQLSTDPNDPQNDPNDPNDPSRRIIAESPTEQALEAPKNTNDPNDPPNSINLNSKTSQIIGSCGSSGSSSRS
jgi:replicative DNA helicase